MARRPNTPCAGCGKLLWPSKNGHQPTCHNCRRKRRDQLPPRPKRQPKPKPKCEVCGDEFRRKMIGQRTCGRDCGVFLRYGLRVEDVGWASCRICRDVITRRSNCHVLCRYRAQHPLEQKRCLECRELFTPDHGQRKYCCKAHARAAIARIMKERRRKRINDGDVVEMFGWRRLAKRQGLVCHLCDEPCDPNADPCKDDWAPTVDHIMPIAMGGTHTFDNARIAHRYCNSMRGTAPVEEARRWLAA